ncbi:MAG TPA: hypothetical protein VN836_12755 [Verrucomicrobiae bacterium]|nr:hypothetical protein [Verrucomicrobiae bacterium]
MSVDNGQPTTQNKIAREPVTGCPFSKTAFLPQAAAIPGTKKSRKQNNPIGIRNALNSFQNCFSVFKM